MSCETYTVALDAETVTRLQAIAESQNLSVDATLIAAVHDYIAAWEDHLADMADAPREDLPWLRPGDEAI